MPRSIVERHVMHLVTDEVRYRLLRYLEEHPQASQRELALHLGVSVGKINYCLRALIEKGLVKMRNFRGSEKKLPYAYILTPKGIDEKVSANGDRAPSRRPSDSWRRS